MVLGTIALMQGAAVMAKNAGAANDVSISCLIYDDLSLYDLRPLQSQSKDNMFEKGNEQYYFNLCGQTIESCSPD